MQTVADFLAPVIAEALPGVMFLHGTLRQLEEGLNKLPVRGQCCCLNDSIRFTVATTGTGAQVVGNTVTLLLGIKSHPGWSPEERNLVQRVTLAQARVLPQAFAKAGATVLAALQGDTFFNLFAVNIDGCQVAYQLQLPDTWDYCIPEIPQLPELPEEELE